MKKQVEFALKLGFSRADAKLLARLNTPEKIQDHIDAMPSNPELDGDTCLAAAGALSLGACHCIEGAFIAASALWVHGKLPLLLDMKAKGDDDHVIVPFKTGKYWGAISKSNHIGLRWRDPIYRTLRELVMSYFHEYTNQGKKTFRSYSRPFDLRRYDPTIWASGKESCWDLAWDLDQSPHYPIISSQQARVLRARDSFEKKIDELAQYPCPTLKKSKWI